METCHEVIAQLEEERKALNKKLERLERELKDEKQNRNKANSKVTELQTRLSQVRAECTAGGNVPCSFSSLRRGPNSAGCKHCPLEFRASSMLQAL